jgi:hypothetical protein
VGLFCDSEKAHESEAAMNYVNLLSSLALAIAVVIAAITEMESLFLDRMAIAAILITVTCHSIRDMIRDEMKQ